MNAIHRVIQRRGTNALNKEVDQYGPYIELENTILPGRVIIGKTVIKNLLGERIRIVRGLVGTGQM